MEIKLGPYYLNITIGKKEFDKRSMYKAWQQPMTREQRELFKWADEVLTGAVPDNLCDLCLAPMGDAFKPVQENLCKRCGGK